MVLINPPLPPRDHVLLFIFEPFPKYRSLKVKRIMLSSLFTLIRKMIIKRNVTCFNNWFVEYNIHNYIYLSSIWQCKEILNLGLHKCTIYETNLAKSSIVKQHRKLILKNKCIVFLINCFIVNDGVTLLKGHTFESELNCNFWSNVLAYSSF